MAIMNLKSLVSLGSASALAAASLVGLAGPANAAAGLTIEVTEGSGFTFVEGSDPSFTIAGNSDFISSNGSQLRVRLKAMDTSSLTVNSFTINGVTLSDNYTDANVGNAIAFVGATAENDDEPASGDGTVDSILQTAGSTAVFGLGVSTSSFSESTSTSLMTSPFTFTFDTDESLADNATDVFEMTAWADANNNGAVDTGEIAATQALTFIAGEDVTGSVTQLTPAVAGAASFTGKVELNVNEAYVQSDDVGVQVSTTDTGTAVDAANLITAGSTVVSNGILSNVTNFALDSTSKDHFDFTVTPSVGATSGEDLAATGLYSKFSLQALFDLSLGGSLDDATDAVGTAITVNTGAVSVSSTESSLIAVAGANAVDAGTITGTSNTADVRLNAEFTAQVDLEDTNGDNLVGKAVTFTFSDNVVLSDSRTVTIDGTTYSSDLALAAVSLSKVTNASGKASVTVKTTGFANGEDVIITATADGVAEQLTANSEEPDYTADFVEGSVASNTGYAKTIAAGGSLDVAIAVADEFGVAPANGTTRITLTRATSTARTTAANWNYVLPVVDGVASGTIVDNGAGAGSDVVTATLSGTDASSTETFTLNYSTAAASDVASITVTDNQGTGDSVVRLDADELPAWHYFLTAGATEPDADASNFANGSTTAASDTLLAITGTALNAAGVGVSGKNVTVSATGITFKFTDATGNNEIYARDSISVPTGAGGTFTVNAFSDGKGGSTVITVSSGSASGSTTVTFDGGVANALDLSVPATASEGRATDVIATVTDVAGDPVEGITISFKATGVGYLSNLSGTSDSDGQVVVKLITQPAETGLATITATATLDGVSTSQVGTIDIGGTAAADQKVNAGSFKGFVAIYAKGYEGDRLSAKVGNDWVVVPTLASNFERIVEFTGAGYSISVPIYINRVLVETIAVTTK